MDQLACPVLTLSNVWLQRLSSSLGNIRLLRYFVVEQQVCMYGPRPQADKPGIQIDVFGIKVSADLEEQPTPSVWRWLTLWVWCSPCAAAFGALGPVQQRRQSSSRTHTENPQNHLLRVGAPEQHQQAC